MIVVDDASTDGTGAVVARSPPGNPRVRCVPIAATTASASPCAAGLEAFSGDAVAIVMADGSDCPEDIVAYHRLLEEGYDCAFGIALRPRRDRARLPALEADHEPDRQLVGIRVLFRHGYNDTTNAFKAYRREVIENIEPFLSHHFNLTVELPLKAVVRGYRYGIVPISWTNRKAGASKLRLQRDGQPLPLHRPLCLPRAPPQPRRLPPQRDAQRAAAWDLASRAPEPVVMDAAGRNISVFHAD